jgi:phage anti-repressor protein
MNTLSLKEFLKKYSTLSNDFINDFYAIYDFNEHDNNDFIINIDIVAKWLGSKKGKIKETLVNTYNVNIDYKISKEKPNHKISKSNKEIILMTPDCFKRLCLLSKTKKGEEVRTYFIELEKLINNYKNYIIEGLKSTVKILENNQKPIPSNIKGVIYILKSPKDIDGIYRFGKTQDFKNRLANYNSSNSDKMEVLFIFETKNLTQIESCVISQIKQFRYKKRKDFFQIDINIIKELINSCDQLTLKFKKKIYKSNKNNNKTGGNSTDNFFLYLHK